MSCITIYFGDKPVYLCSELTAKIEETRHHPDAVFIDELSTSAINSLLHEIKKPAFHAGIILHPDFARLRKNFFKHFKLIQAGGGLVENNSDEILLILRRGKWDLPKGKLDSGETLEECALREVGEETGVQRLKIVSKINTTYHTYDEFGKHILKESHWYLMKAINKEELIPQLEEDITEIRWVKRHDLKDYFNNTFPTIKSVLENSRMIDLN